MCGLHVNYISSVVGHVYDVAGIYVQAHMSIICNVCISVLVVTVLIALSTYIVYILT